MRFGARSLLVALGMTGSLLVGSAVVGAQAHPPALAKGDQKKNHDEPGKKKNKPDRTAPRAPTVSSTSAGAGGVVYVSFNTSQNARLVVRTSNGRVVATSSGPGSQRSLSWSTSSGTHRYQVTATDPAGNRSRPTGFTATADALPPSLTSPQAVAGDAQDSRSRLSFLTDAGARFRILVDGRVVRERDAADPRVASFIDVANGPHRVRVEVRDGVGNVASWNHRLRVNISKLAVDAAVVSDPTARNQKIHVTATPNATRGVLRVQGEGKQRFRLFRGESTVPIRLADGTYDGVTVSVSDGRGRTGGMSLPDLVVDTTPPALVVQPDDAAGEQGTLKAAVVTDPDAAVEWRVLDSAGTEVTSGELVAIDGTTTIEQDVDEGTYQLAVSVQDKFDRTTTTTISSRISADPWPIALVILLVLVALGVLGLAIRLLRPLVPRLRERASLAWRRAQDHMAERRATRADADAADVALIVPRQRSRQQAVATVLQVAEAGAAPGPVVPEGLFLLPDERVLHATTGELLESHGDDADGVALELESHDGRIVVTDRRVIFVGDLTREWWIWLTEEFSHVGTDRTMMRRWRETAWSGLVYDDAEVTRLQLDLLMAERQGNRRNYLDGLKEELSAEDELNEVEGSASFLGGFDLSR